MIPNLRMFVSGAYRVTKLEMSSKSHCFSNGQLWSGQWILLYVGRRPFPPFAVWTSQLSVNHNFSSGSLNTVQKKKSAKYFKPFDFISESIVRNEGKYWRDYEIGGKRILLGFYQSLSRVRFSPWQHLAIWLMVVDFSNHFSHLLFLRHLPFFYDQE